MTSLPSNLLTLRFDRRIPIDLADYKLRSAQESDYIDVVDRSCLLYEGGKLAIVYLELDNDSSDIIEALHQVEYHTNHRTDGLLSTSRTFGYLPRNTLRRDFCAVTDLATKQPHEHATVISYARMVEHFYRDLNPPLYAEHQEKTERVLREYVLPGSVFTSGIINKNNPLKYHFDKGNFENVWSCMLVFKGDIEGGYLAVPEFNLAFELKNNSLLMFDGQAILHGVTPIRRMSPDAFRYSVVFYSMDKMWSCLPLGEELSRIQTLRTQRERKRAQAMRDTASLEMFPEVKYPIFVTSKGRARQAPVLGILRACKLPYFLVVEPQDLDAYRQDYPEASFFVLPENDQGLAYARQKVLDYCRAESIPWFWLLDDNIKQFMYVKDRVKIPVTANVVFAGIERLVEQYVNVAMASPDYQQFAVFAESEYTANTRTYCAVLINAQTGLNYRPGVLDMKSDVDWCLQHLAAGWNTLLVHSYAMDKPTMGLTRVGGQADNYRKGRDSMYAHRVHRLWPNVTELVQKKRGTDVKVNWRAFTTPLLKREETWEITSSGSTIVHEDTIVRESVENPRADT